MSTLEKVRDVGLSDAITREAAEALLFDEAACLDEHRWDEWLDLYTADAIYWVPSWKDHAEPTSDPDRELSLIYYTERTRLEERVWRIRSGLAPAAVPLPRSLHMIGNIRLDPDLANVVHANAAVHVYDPRRHNVQVHFGRYRIEARSERGAWRIANKKILILNDYLPSSIDIYSI